jgi:predicted lipoprotein with Yx(FWY)xxD motif
LLGGATVVTMATETLNEPHPKSRSIVGALRKSVIATAAIIGLLGSPLVTSTASAATTTGATVISTSNGPFGKTLVVGSGQYQGYTVYLLTSDDPPSFGCTTVVKQLPPGPIACTGPEGSQSEWPAVTTTGSPIAGSGVKQRLLGMVFRSDLGADQVTYAGHPLYLFDMSAGSITGEGWDEPGLPPWHGLWYVVSAKGTPVPWAGMLTTSTIGGKTVLAAQMDTLAGWISFPVYRYSKDECSGACARSWPPLLTAGTPGTAGLAKASRVGARKIAGGLSQVTYNGQALYFYGDETPNLAGGRFVPVGNGNGKKDAGGSFHLVAP